MAFELHKKKKKIMKNISRILLLVIAVSITIISVSAQSTWPRSIQIDNGGKIVIYQPQPEGLNGDVLAARAAVSITTANGVEPTFGSIWFDAYLQTNNNSSTLESLNIKDAKFPEIKDQQQLQSYISVIQSEVPKWNMKFSTDQLNASVEQAKQLTQPNLKNDAPKIIYRDKASTLIIIDGQPKVQLDSKTGLKRVVNTPSTIVLNPGDNKYYFYGGGLWYSSNNVMDGWSYSPELPTSIQKLDAQIQAAQKKDTINKNQDSPSTPSDVVVSTVPAELIQTDGSPTYQTIQGTNLLYVDNSLNDIFKDINTQQNYILLAGRWYTSKSLNGPWDYVPADKLPSDFAMIPEGSEKDGVLSSVAGTDAANEALMDAQIPQTAKIDRQTATTHVTYDGSPVFKRIKGTNLSVAENSNETVIKSNANGNYYAVDNGVWFVSNSPRGSWIVSTERPSDVDDIPADNIAYNVKYVFVYDYTPDYVYTGYTPGYLGCYSYGSTVVWGTGWYYDAWYRQIYYPRPYTWGFGMAYNPWTGWSIGYESGYSLGGRYYNSNPYGRGWFGPRVYHPNYREWGYNGGYYGRHANVRISEPRVTVNRPVYITQNNHYNIPRTFYSGRNHTANLYNHVRGAVTVDVNRAQGAVIEHKYNGGRPANPSIGNWGNNKGGTRGQPVITNNDNYNNGSNNNGHNTNSNNHYNNGNNYNNGAANNNNGVVTPNQPQKNEVIGRPRGNNGNDNHPMRPIVTTPVVQQPALPNNNSNTPPPNNGAAQPIKRPFVEPTIQPSNNNNNNGNNNNTVTPRSNSNIGRPAVAPREVRPLPVPVDRGGSNNNHPTPAPQPQVVPRPQPPVHEQPRPIKPADDSKPRR